MFDFTQIVEKVTGLIGDNNLAQDVLGGNLGETLANVDLDPSLLENLSLDQAHDLLAGAGIDASALTDGQIADIIAQLTQSGPG